MLKMRKFKHLFRPHSQVTNKCSVQKFLEYIFDVLISQYSCSRLVKSYTKRKQ